MARLWSCGFELQSTSTGIEYTATNVGGAASISTSIKRSGEASLRINTSSGTQSIDMLYRAANSTNRIFYRFYLYIASMPSVNTFIFSHKNLAGTYGGSLTLSTGGLLRIFNDVGGAAVGNSSAALNTGQWYRIEFDYNDASGDTASAYLDGIEFSGGVTLGNLGGGGRVELGPTVATTADLYFDDVAINDTSGSAQTGLPGPGSIVHMQPNATGDNTQWQDDASASQGTATLANINEVTPDDATNYNKRTTNAPATQPIDDWGCESPGSAGIGPYDQITLVSVGTRNGATSATATNRNITLRIKSQASGTLATSGTVDVSVNGWQTHVDSSSDARVYQLTSYTDPQAGGSWTPALLDSMQIGYQAAASSTNEIRVTTIWALVEYIPQPAPPLVVLQAVRRAALY